MFLLLLFTSQLALADTVVSCNDGDTCRFIDAKKIVRKVRFAGIDAPETDQQSKKPATAYLLNLLIGKKAELKCSGKSDDRIVCEVFVGKDDISMQMVEAGWAWDYPQYSNGKYKAAQEKAKSAKLGLWKEPNIESPFCFRYIGTPDCSRTKNQYQP